MKETKQTNKQNVYFQSNGRWFQNQIDLKDIYTMAHANHSGYGTSANVLVNEMLANLLDVVGQGLADLNAPLVITDFGCGQSKAANVLAAVVSENYRLIDKMLEQSCSYGDILDKLAPAVKAADDQISGMDLEQIMSYGHITVQRFDIGVPKFSAPLPQKANIAFCNDVFEHIPQPDIPAFVEDLENSGDFVIASISLRDAVNYNKIKAEVLLNGAEELAGEPDKGVILTKDVSGDYIFSLHVTIMPQDKWQELLGEKWTLLPAQDYTACSAMNFRPSDEYQAYKKELIAQIGFADFIPFPTPLGTKYENDPILFRRTAAMQPQKHLYKLNALEGYPESDFTRKERAETMAFLKFLDADAVKNEQTGLWEFEALPQDYLNKLYALEALSKEEAQDDRSVAAAAAALIAEYNSGDTSKIDCML